MRICVSGSTGFIGSNLCDALSSSNHNIFCIVRKESDVSRISSYSNCTIIRYNTYEDMYRLMRTVQPECLIHLAGYFCSNHSQSNILDMIECNLTFSTVLVDAAVSSGCRRIINTSTYWEHYDGCLYEPVNLYAGMKKAFEDILMYYACCHNCHVTTLTIFDTYGYGDWRKKILNIIRDMPEGSSIDMSEGSQLISLVYIDDIVEAFLWVIPVFRPGLFEKFSLLADNLNILSLRDIVTKLLTIARKDINVKWGAIPMREREIIDPRSIGEVLPGWRPKVGIDQGLNRFLGK